ncbi:hypothetical protein ERN12_08585 [Rhodobacteraceae bacterium]|nr:hypothetical protein ERN12_08585 [Paracoccaceae bacterium]
MGRIEQGAMAYHGGLAAEQQVAREYEALGLQVVARRWRGHHGGEIDLILGDQHLVVFTEVKRARSFEAAVARITPRQLHRIALSAQEFCATSAAWRGARMRFDIALVDAHGQIRLQQNAVCFDGM